MILPTFWRFGSLAPEPGFFAVDSPAAFLMSTAFGGVLVMKVKERSLYTVITTGMIRSPWLAVLALNSLQNPMMLTPC